MYRLNGLGLLIALNAIYGGGAYDSAHCNVGAGADCIFYDMRIYTAYAHEHDKCEQGAKSSS